MYIKSLADLSALFVKWVNDYHGERIKFLDRMEQNPSYALSWSGGMFELAPKYMLASHYLATLKEREIAEAGGTEVASEALVLAGIHQTVLVRTLDGARRPKTTATCHDLIAANETAAYAALLSEFGPVQDLIPTEER